MKTEKFKNFLLEKGVSQSSLAKKLGVTPKTLCDKINGKNDFKVKEMFLICNELGIDNPREFFE